MGGVCAVSSLSNNVAEDPGDEREPLARAGDSAAAAEDTTSASASRASAGAGGRGAAAMGPHRHQRGPRWRGYDKDRLYHVDGDRLFTVTPTLSALCVRSLCRSLPFVDEVPPGLPVELTQQIMTSLVEHNSLDADMLRTLRHCEFVDLPLSRCRDVTDEWLLATSALSVRSLQHLDLSQCSRITTDGVLHLHALKSLTAASFAECHLLEGPATLCLTSSWQLQALDCTNCRRLCDAAVQHVRHLTGLTELSLSGTNVSDAALEHVAALTNLRVLQLERCRRLSDRGVANLVGLRCLRELRLGWCGVSDASLQLLASLPQHQPASSVGAAGLSISPLASGKIEVHLSSTGPPDSPNFANGGGGGGGGGGSVRKQPLRVRASSYPPDPLVLPPVHLPLTHLDLSRCAITDDGVRHLTTLRELSRLSLAGCQGVTDDGITQLADLPQLSWLDVSSIQRLAHVGGLFGTLDYLDMSHTQVDDHALLAMLSAAREHDARHRARMHDRPRSPPRAATTRATALSLDASEADQPSLSFWAGHDAAAGVTELESCGAAAAEPGRAGAAADSAALNGYCNGHAHRLGGGRPGLQLRSLVLDSCIVSDRGVEAVVQMESLTKLNLADTRISDVAMAHIARRLSKLESLSLFFCDVSDNGMQRLSSLTNLTELNLDNREISDAGLVPLAQMTKLATLDVFSAYRVTDDGVVHISKLTSLTSLELCGGRLTNLAVAHLTGLINLSALNLAQNLGINDEAMKYLTNMSSLTELNLSECRVTSNGLPWLAQLVNLASLALVNCRFVTQSALEQLQQDLPALRCVRT